MPIVLPSVPFEMLGDLLHTACIEWGQEIVYAPKIGEQKTVKAFARYLNVQERMAGFDERTIFVWVSKPQIPDMPVQFDRFIWHGRPFAINEVRPIAPKDVVYGWRMLAQGGQ